MDEVTSRERGLGVARRGLGDFERDVAVHSNLERGKLAGRNGG